METTFDGELRLFLEELCCELCRLRHVAEDGVAAEARPRAEAQPGEIVVSNAFYQALDEDTQGEFVENRPVIAKNVGTLRAGAGWRSARERRRRPGEATIGRRSA